ncbi:hypothetical protein EVAR_35442_1 [Eumeta japonica]|uniref:Uncharacterized protein n=1 Tax=Eumeta variegata TaxID=151549 RepID=A0A4C1Z6N4_EUMVA|nr:hypothetical protein EVAR_35442_1 [Eumeta japonica]
MSTERGRGEGDVEWKSEVERNRRLRPKCFSSIRPRLITHDLHKTKRFFEAAPPISQLRNTSGELRYQTEVTRTPIDIPIVILKIYTPPKPYLIPFLHPKVGWESLSPRYLRESCARRGAGGRRGRRVNPPEPVECSSLGGSPER